MDGKGFDDLTRKVAQGVSRRTLLRGLIGAGAAVVATKASESHAASKVTICHHPPGNPGKVQMISVSANAVAAHVANHGDTVLGTVASCSRCGDICQAVDACTPARCDNGVCNTVSNGCCTDDPIEVTCAGVDCGEVANNCGTSVQCGQCSGCLTCLSNVCEPSHQLCPSGTCDDLGGCHLQCLGNCTEMKAPICQRYFCDSTAGMCQLTQQDNGFLCDNSDPCGAGLGYCSAGECTYPGPVPGDSCNGGTGNCCG